MAQNSTGVGPHNVGRWRESFEAEVHRLLEAEGEDFDDKTDWVKFDIWSMYGKFICPRYLQCSIRQDDILLISKYF